MKLQDIKEASDFTMRLDHMIQGVLAQYKGFLPKNATLDNVRRLVQMDYSDSDITKVTPRDIVEIIDASATHDENDDEVLRIG